MITVTLYTRQECSLCDKAEKMLQDLQETVPHQLTKIDIDNDPKLAQQYGEQVPMILVGPYTLKAPIKAQDLEITLRAVQMRADQDQKIDANLASGNVDIEVTWGGTDRFSLWMGRHYLAFVNILIGLYLFGSFLPALLMEANLPGVAHIFYKGYSYVCHQLPYRSWFLFGEQPAYPRELAHVDGLIPFQQATGIDESLDAVALWNARSYVGDEHIGYKVALCERDVAIYASMLAFGLLFALWRRIRPDKPIKPLHWLAWILIGIIPIGLDGGTQLVSQYIPALGNIFPLRESTPFLRSLTGFLFGFTTAWFGIPYMEESFGDTKRIFERKKMIYDRQQSIPSEETGG